MARATHSTWGPYILLFVVHCVAACPPPYPGSPPGGDGTYSRPGPDVETEAKAKQRRSIREKDVVGLLFSAIDQNRNGVVDFDEWEQASMPGNNEDFGQLLDAFDTNGDSVFSEDEFRGVYEEWMAGNLSEPHPANV